MQPTESILTTINGGLSTKFEDCMGELHDRITTLIKQMRTKDTSMSDTIEHLSDTTNTITSTVEQKASQILNKTKHLALFSLRTESDNPDATCELSP